MAYKNKMIKAKPTGKRTIPSIAINSKIIQRNSSYTFDEKEQNDFEIKTTNGMIAFTGMSPSLALHSAVLCNNFESIPGIIYGGEVDVNHIAYSGMSALHEASLSGKFQCVQYLVVCGADVNLKDYEGWTPLHAAVYGGEIECLECLIAAGADLNAETDDGLSPFHLALATKNEEIQNFLISKLTKETFV